MDLFDPLLLFVMRIAHYGGAMTSRLLHRGRRNRATRLHERASFVDGKYLPSGRRTPMRTRARVPQHGGAPLIRDEGKAPAIAMAN
ncbi:hypothetical protein [Aquincola sp. J276]|uniref:hypothetical protein n=1 Tax=Aquincola sp. J276 TaxID=2898432 RepID=UPI0021512B41|nr:hypothetical protein [Aquincola sp. J276]MCR5864669.1 hypothetical protein [Aquincola sp. J276]